MDTKRYLCCLIYLLCSFFVCCHSTFGQTLSPNDDFDTVLVPVGQTVAPEGNSFIGNTPEAMGLQSNPVEGFAEADVLPSSATDQIQIRLRQGQAISFWSKPIIVEPSPLMLSCNVTVEGATPQQAALAMVDGQDPRRLGVSLLYNDDIPRTERDFSMEYECRSNRVFFILQFAGPSAGQSIVTVKRLRLLPNYRELDDSVGANTISETIYFNEENQNIILNTPPSSADGVSFQIKQDVNRTKLPATQGNALHLITSGADKVIQLLLPQTLAFRGLGNQRYPKRVYAEAYARRMAGETGIFTLALFSGSTTSVGYVDVPVEQIPSDEWVRILCPVQFGRTAMLMNDTFALNVILQIRGGNAELAVDDVSLKSTRDSLYLWNADKVIEYLNN